MIYVPLCLLPIAFVPPRLRVYCLLHMAYSLQASTKCHCLTLHEKSVRAKRTHLTVVLYRVKHHRRPDDAASNLIGQFVATCCPGAPGVCALIARLFVVAVLLQSDYVWFSADFAMIP